MLQQNERGAVNGMAFSLVIAILLLVCAVAFGGWAFSSRQDYKNHTDAKIVTAVTVAKQQESTLKDAQFAQAEKNPLTTYNGPEAYGSIVLQYPKTWSGYAASTSSGNGGGSPVSDYFYPGVVPSTADPSSVYALRLQVLNQTYASTVNSLSQGGAESTNRPTISPYVLPKVPSAIGVEVTGTLPVSNGGSGSKTGVMVILPLRSETIELWTEGSQFTSDFTNSVLPNFSFSP
jgi:hypothetical protein